MESPHVVMRTATSRTPTETARNEKPAWETAISLNDKDFVQEVRREMQILVLT
jgi:hypothetical protein